MKMNAYIAGVGMTPFGSHIDTSLKSLAGQAMQLAIADAGIEKGVIEAAYMSNAVGGLIVGQAMIPGQVALREMGIGRIPVINLENACASASTALNQAAAMVSAGLYDVVLACGYEKLFHEDKMRTFSAFSSAVDVEDPTGLPALLEKTCVELGIEMPDQTNAAMRSAFMDIYAVVARHHMKEYGTTAEQFAAVSAKNSFTAVSIPMPNTARQFRLRMYWRLVKLSIRLLCQCAHLSVTVPPLLFLSARKRPARWVLGTRFASRPRFWGPVGIGRWTLSLW